MKKLLIVALAMATLTGFYSCKKNNKTEPDVPKEEEYEHDLTPEGVVFWDSQETINIIPHDVVLPNGERLDDFLTELDDNGLKKSGGKNIEALTKELGPQKAKLELIANLTKAALDLTDDSKFHHAAGTNANEPEQYGLGYSWGQRDYTKRKVPPGTGNKCTDAIYGLDCSGLLYIFKKWHYYNCGHS